jgi:hypothetical protein
VQGVALLGNSVRLVGNLNRVGSTAPIERSVLVCLAPDRYRHGGHGRTPAPCQERSYSDVVFARTSRWLGRRCIAARWPTSLFSMKRSDIAILR